ncbi:MAG: hypothetical protein FD180_4211 [Planctomycetota bacterium]|nr:MAG: hypothetical protein FD180_4211 [Planctomycetota bacterium]
MSALRPLKTWAWESLFVVAAILIAAAFFLRAGAPNRAPNALVVRNSSGKLLQDIRVVILEKDGGDRVERDFGVLGPADSILVRHGMNDSSVEVTFTISGQEFRHKEGYVDLWTGETWVVDVKSGGTTVSGYSGNMGFVKNASK